MITFRYREEMGKVTGPTKRPVADVKILASGGKWVELHMYIDSGADITLIPYTLGLYLGFESPKEIIELVGARGIALPVEIRKVKMKIGDMILEPRVAWALIEEAPPLLGRLDIFDHFDITFKENDGLILFKPLE